jgi:hypothetical protein
MFIHLFPNDQEFTTAAGELESSVQEPQALSKTERFSRPPIRSLQSACEDEH